MGEKELLGGRGRIGIPEEAGVGSLEKEGVARPRSDVTEAGNLQTWPWGEGELPMLWAGTFSWCAGK